MRLAIAQPECLCHQSQLARIAADGASGMVTRLRAVSEDTHRTSQQAPRWVSTAEAAFYLGVTPRTVYRFIDDGVLPAYRFGRVIRIKAADLDEFIETSRIKPGSLDHLHPGT